MVHPRDNFYQPQEAAKNNPRNNPIFVNFVKIGTLCWNVQFKKSQGTKVSPLPVRDKEGEVKKISSLLKSLFSNKNQKFTHKMDTP